MSAWASTGRARPAVSRAWPTSGVSRPSQRPARLRPERRDKRDLGVRRDPNADLAAEFIAFTTGADQARRRAATSPPRLSLQEASVLAEVNPILSEEDIKTTIVDALAAENASWGYSHKQWGALQTNAQRVFDGNIWKPDGDVKAGLDQVCTDIADLLG